MARCQNLTRTAALLLGAALLSTSARAEDPSAIIEPPAYLVNVRLLGDRPDFHVTLNLVRIGAEDVPLCTEPCDRALSIKPYQRFVIAPDHASGAVHLAYEEIPPFALPADPQSVLIRVRSGKPERRIAGAFVLGGGFVFGGLGLLTGLGAQLAISTGDGADRTTARTVRNAGFIVAGAGLLAAVTGFLLIELSPAPGAEILKN